MATPPHRVPISARESTTQSKPSLNELEQDAEHWNTAGNIVLICGLSAFRTDSSLLSQNSEVFLELLNTLESPAPGSPFECSFLRLDDSAEGIKLLLDHLQGKHPIPAQGSADFSQVATLLELAHKYRVRDLFQEALARVKTVFTEDFDVWDELAQVNALSSAALHVNMSDSVRLINVAQALGLGTMLPFAFYLCCLADTRLLTRGYAYESGIAEKLSLEDLERCINGKPMLAHQCRSGMARMYTGASVHCTNKSRCSSTLLQLLAYPGTVQFGALARADELVDQVSKHYGICDDCNLHMKTKHLEWRKKVWQELPGYFGLGSWEQLRVAESSL